MEQRISTNDWLLIAGGLGACGALLFTGADGELLLGWGPNLLVWTLMALGALAWGARRAKIELSGDGLWFVLPLLFFAGAFALREDGFLRFWNGVFFLVSAALLVTRSRGPWRASLAGYTEYVRLCALAAAYTVAGPFAALGAGKPKLGAIPGGQAPRVVMPNSRLGAIGKPAPVGRTAVLTDEAPGLLQIEPVDPGHDAKSVSGSGPGKPVDPAAHAAAAEVASWFMPGPPAPVPLPGPAAAPSPAPAPTLTPTPVAAPESGGGVAAVLPRAGLVTPAAVLKGMLLSAIPLMIFGSLFASADPVFGRFVGEVFDWDAGALAGHIAWGAMLGFVGLGLLHTALQRVPPPDQRDRDILPDGSVAPIGLTALFQHGGDVIVALGLIDLLFAAFVAVQFGFLFGGGDIVRSVPGLSYAAYARGGFFELAWVAGLALPVLLLAHWLTRTAPDAARRRVRQATGILTALLFVVIASAFKRMALYESALGLTVDRLLVSVFIGAISVVLVWFLATAWRNKSRHFAVGLLCAAMLTIGGLDVVNTDALVINVDAHRAAGLRGFSRYDLESLGADAVPALAANILHASPGDQPGLATYLLGGTDSTSDGGYDDVESASGWNSDNEYDWRVWNGSDAAGQQAVNIRNPLLTTLAAQAPKAASATSSDGDCGCSDAPPAAKASVVEKPVPKSAAGVKKPARVTRSAISVTTKTQPPIH